MSRTAVWVAILIGGIGYHAIKQATGFGASWENLFDSTYWSGGALTMHWWMSRKLDAFD
jgi:hypothetical protein